MWWCRRSPSRASAGAACPVRWRRTQGRAGGELLATNAGGVYVQRVFAQGFEVGKQGSYHYWLDHWRKPGPGGQDFWFPDQKYASYSIKQGREASEGAFAAVLTVGLAPVFIVLTKLFKNPTNASPDKDWKIELSAPDLAPPFKPQSLRFGEASDQFDEGYAPAGESRQAGKQRDAERRLFCQP